MKAKQTFTTPIFKLHFQNNHTTHYSYKYLRIPLILHQWDFLIAYYIAEFTFSSFNADLGHMAYSLLYRFLYNEVK